MSDWLKCLWERNPYSSTADCALWTSTTTCGWVKKKRKRINRVPHYRLETSTLHWTHLQQWRYRRAKVAAVLAFASTLVIMCDQGGQLPSWNPKIALGMCHLLPPGVEWQDLRGRWIAAAAAALLVTFPHRELKIFLTPPWWLHISMATWETRNPLP